MKKMVKMLSLVMGMSVMLCACGNSKGDVAKAEKDTTKTEEDTSKAEKETEKKGQVPLSERLKEEEPVIFYRVEAIDKEEEPDVYIFKDGKVTEIDSDDMKKTFGELSKMSDEEILEAAEEAKKNYRERKTRLFEEQWAHDIELLEQGKYAPRVSEEEAIEQKRPWSESDEVFLGVTDEDAKRGLEILKEWQPKGPVENTYALNVNTDASGNCTLSEEIIIAGEGDGSGVGSYSESDMLYSLEISEEPSVYCECISLESKSFGTIYDSFYSGWKCENKRVFVTRVESEVNGVCLDTPNAKGVEVDKKNSEIEEKLKEEVLEKINNK